MLAAPNHKLQQTAAKTLLSRHHVQQAAAAELFR
jgi:hypothetical protein